MNNEETKFTEIEEASARLEWELIHKKVLFCWYNREETRGSTIYYHPETGEWYFRWQGETLGTTWLSALYCLPPNHPNPVGSEKHLLTFGPGLYYLPVAFYFRAVEFWYSRQLSIYRTVYADRATRAEASEEWERSLIIREEFVFISEMYEELKNTLPPVPDEAITPVPVIPPKALKRPGNLLDKIAAFLEQFISNCGLVEACTNAIHPESRYSDLLPR